MTLIFGEGSPTTNIDKTKLSAHLDHFVNHYKEKLKDRFKKVLIVPPDFTRFHSFSGEVTVLLYEKLKSFATIHVLPALGTHVMMTDAEITKMFPGMPRELFIEHNWRTGIKKIGDIPSTFIKEITKGKLDYSVQVDLSEIIVDGNYDLIISVGQVVPHEVVGMANHNKNIFIGVGGKDFINRSHFIGAVYGMETMMGRPDSPVRQVFDYAEKHFASQYPFVYIQTVVNRDTTDGQLKIRGVYSSENKDSFLKAAELAVHTNLDLMTKPFKKAVVYLDPAEFKSTWLGNKAVYRTRMAMADDGDLIILAPGLKEFGEDKEIDRLIRKYGYKGTPTTLKNCDENEELRLNYSAAAHLIHGSSEGRFRITYCPGHLTKEEIESVNFQYADLQTMLKKYNPETLKDGYNIVDGEEIFYISNPALGLWALKEKFI